MSHTSNHKRSTVIAHPVGLSLRLPESLHARIKDAAKADQRSVASWIRIALDRELRLNNQDRA